MKPSHRSHVHAFQVMELLREANELAARGRDILHMEAGQPGTAAPKPVREAAKHAIDTELMGYTEALGLPALRARIAGFYGERYDVDVAPERIVVTQGSSAGFILAFLGVFDTAARVALGAPYYPAYPNILTALGFSPVILETGPNSNFQPTVDHVIHETEPTELDGLMLLSPANPTGSMLRASDLKALIEVCADRDIRLISDEIYHGITYGERAHSALEFTQDAVVVNSFSKYFSMPGWRLGWLVVPEDLIKPLERLSQNLYISNNAVSQAGALAVFDCEEELEANVAQYARNREILLRELPKTKFNIIAPPEGAFYVYTDVSHLTDDAQAFCRKMLEETGIAATPGVDFDRGERARRVRFSYAGPEADIIAAVERLQNWLPA